ncbi:MAG: MFS transporter [Paracoccaceae bacterium]
MDRFAMGLTVAVVVLALIDRDLDLFQISLLFGVYSVTTMAMELPFGGLTDTIGRKPVFLVAVLASMISLVVFLFSQNFYVLSISFAFIGFGRALRSGMLDVWFVENFKVMAPNVDIQPALAKAQWANAMGLALGAICGGHLPDAFGDVALRFGFSAYDISYAASLVMMVFLFCVTIFLIKEEPRPLTPKALWGGVKNVPSIIKGASILAVTQPTLLLLLIAVALTLMATNPVEVFWPTQVKNMLNAGHANTTIGILTAVYFTAIALGAALSPRVNRMFGRQNAVTLSAALACLLALQIILACQSNSTGFVLVFTLFSLVLGVMETPASSLLHSCVEIHQRSTLLSLRSLVQQLGAAFGLMVVGVFAQSYTVSIAWIVAAAFLGLAVILIWPLTKTTRL